MYSVRMRAGNGTKHISGAERIVQECDIKAAVQSLIERALSHDRGKPDFINISIEQVNSIKHLRSLPVTLSCAGNVGDGKKAAKSLLSQLGIPSLCVEEAFSILENGESMRGAILMNMEGERLEPDKRRGIRASRMDITAHAAKELERSLAVHGMGEYFTHIKEALVLATKVASVEGTVAELCWSDDPFYTAGYVASRKAGYVRFPHLKNEGDFRGGRVFFVNEIMLEDYIHEMEHRAVIVDEFAGINTGGKYGTAVIDKKNKS